MDNVLTLNFKENYKQKITSSRIIPDSDLEAPVRPLRNYGMGLIHSFLH